MITLLLSLAISLGSLPSCDMIELNHYCDTLGNPIFTQLIFWKWYDREAKYHVQEWKMVEHSTVVYRFNKRVLVEKTTALHFKESWTQFDPEREDWIHHPRRLPLRTP